MISLKVFTKIGLQCSTQWMMPSTPWKLNKIVTSAAFWIAVCDEDLLIMRNATPENYLCSVQLREFWLFFVFLHEAWLVQSDGIPTLLITAIPPNDGFSVRLSLCSNTSLTSCVFLCCSSSCGDIGDFFCTKSVNFCSAVGPSQLIADFVEACTLCQRFIYVELKH